MRRPIMERPSIAIFVIMNTPGRRIIAPYAIDSILPYPKWVEGIGTDEF
jgi:hypothetical protein